MLLTCHSLQESLQDTVAAGQCHRSDLLSAHRQQCTQQSISDAASHMSSCKAIAASVVVVLQSLQDGCNIQPKLRVTCFRQFSVQLTSDKLVSSQWPPESSTADPTSTTVRDTSDHSHCQSCMQQCSFRHLSVNLALTSLSACSGQLKAAHQTPQAHQSVTHLIMATASCVCTLLAISATDLAQLGASLTADMQIHAQERRAWRTHRIAACRNAAQVCCSALGRGCCVHRCDFQLYRSSYSIQKCGSGVLIHFTHRVAACRNAA